VAAKINKNDLLDMIKTAETFFDLLKTPKSKRKVGVLGINPHAGEIKNLGFEERNIISPAIHEAQSLGHPVDGPLVPDVAFQNPNYKKYPLFIAMYHDQGLIPFKMLHKKNHGVQISLNTPFVRVSVDHGTAKDIFGKNKADPTSMISAIKTALKIV
jgi:4-hydroxythreonine-4-phosphate dehydrogenase